MGCGAHLTARLAALFCATYLLSMEAVADSWIRYQSPFALGPDHVFDLAAKRMAAGGDVVDRIEVCGPGGDYDCLMLHDAFALSVPRKGVANGTRWRIGKFTFVAIGGGPVRMGGRSLNATFIDTIADDAPGGRATVRAVYDAKYGLVGWAHLRWDVVPETSTVYPDPTLTHAVFAKDIGLWARSK